VTTNNSFTDKERAAWHEDHRTKWQGHTDTEVSSVSGNTCIHCGTPLMEEIPDGYEAALCGACD
jgi:hypothetical protein